jgi:hypothetical protein
MRLAYGLAWCLGWLLAIPFALAVLIVSAIRRLIGGGASSDDPANEIPRNGWVECSCGWCVHPQHHRECVACGKPVRP